MKIGYSVEGSTDRAFLNGLQLRWCPQAELVEGKFRGSTRQSRWREIPKICLELSYKGVELIVFISDSNSDDSNAWRKVARDEEARVPIEYSHSVIVGICQRNIECWLCADADWMANRYGRRAEDFRVSNPKGVFNSALGISCRETKKQEIAELVKQAPLRQWLRNPSFEDFYNRLWRQSKTSGCSIENLRERQG
jgi:hypothetical protein